MKTTLTVLLSVLLLSSSASAIGITTIASITTIAVNSGSIIKEARLWRHPVRAIKKHGKQIKDAVREKK